MHQWRHWQDHSGRKIMAESPGRWASGEEDRGDLPELYGLKARIGAALLYIEGYLWKYSL
jgi:hypothetical protein